MKKGRGGRMTNFKFWGCGGWRKMEVAVHKEACVTRSGDVTRRACKQWNCQLSKEATEKK